jgi:hypothetical protein
VPRFARARYIIRGAEWHDATHPHARNRASSLQDDFVPLDAAGVVDRFDGDQTIRRAWRLSGPAGTPASTRSSTWREGGKTIVFVADLIPTIRHLQDPWVMGTTCFPWSTMAFKQRFIREGDRSGILIVFEHDPLVAAGYIRERDGRRTVEAVL